MSKYLRPFGRDVAKLSNFHRLHLAALLAFADTNLALCKACTMAARCIGNIAKNAQHGKSNSCRECLHLGGSDASKFSTVLNAIKGRYQIAQVEYKFEERKEEYKKGRECQTQSDETIES